MHRMSYTNVLISCVLWVAVVFLAWMQWHIHETVNLVAFWIIIAGLVYMTVIIVKHFALVYNHNKWVEQRHLSNPS